MGIPMAPGNVRLVVRFKFHNTISFYTLFDTYYPMISRISPIDIFVFSLDMSLFSPSVLFSSFLEIS